MNLKKSIIFLTISALTLSSIIIISGCARKNPTVAKVGKLIIATDEFKDAFIKRYRNETNAQKQSFKERMDFLNTLIEKKLKLADAYRKGLDKNAEVMEAGKMSQEQVAVQQILFQSEIIDKIVSEAALKDYYNKMGEEIHAAHILVKSNPMDTTASEQAKSRADSIYQKLIAGANFEELAKQCSDDKSNSNQGGDLGYFKWGRMVDEFQVAAFALKVGEISKPVKSPFGYHIIKLIDRRKVEMKPYEEEKESLKEDMRRQKWAEIREQADAYLADLKKAKGMTYFEDSLKVIFDKISASTAPKNVSLFSDFDENGRKMVVAKWSGGTVTVADLDKKIGGYGEGRFAEPNAFKDVIDGIALPQLLADRAKERKVYDAPEAVKAGKEAREAKMSQLIEKTQIDDKVNLDDKTLQEYYQNNLDKYMTDPMVTVREIMVSDKDLAQKLLDRGRKGESFKKLARKYNQRPATKTTDGKLGPFGKNSYGQISREALTMEVGEFCKNPIRMGKNYSVFLVEEKFPAVQKPFEESRQKVERDYSIEIKNNLRKDWMETLKKEIKVKIYEKNLRKALPFTTEEAESKSTTGKPQPLKTETPQPLKPQPSPPQTE